MGRDRHQIPIVKRETNCFMAELFKSCLGHQFYYELTGTLTVEHKNIVRWFDQDFHSRHETHSHHVSPWPRQCHSARPGQAAPQLNSQIASDDISLIFKIRALDSAAQGVWASQPARADPSSLSCSRHETPGPRVSVGWGHVTTRGLYQTLCSDISIKG